MTIQPARHQYRACFLLLTEKLRIEGSGCKNSSPGPWIWWADKLNTQQRHLCFLYRKDMHQEQKNLVLSKEVPRRLSTFAANSKNLFHPSFFERESIGLEHEILT